MTLPLDRGLNVAVLQIASQLFPLGYDVSPHAPDTLKKLKTHLSQPGARMIVYNGGADNTIFEDNEVNYAFRAWHDWCHWRGNYDFTPEGELKTCKKQVEQLKTLYGDGPTVERWADILWAEVVGQRRYYAIHGRFLDNQRAFTEAYLANPDAALANPSW
jgi:hypothetical protein